MPTRQCIRNHPRSVDPSRHTQSRAIASTIARLDHATEHHMVKNRVNHPLACPRNTASRRTFSKGGPSSASTENPAHALTGFLAVTLCRFRPTTSHAPTSRSRRPRGLGGWYRLFRGSATERLRSCGTEVRYGWPNGVPSRDRSVLAMSASTTSQNFASTLRFSRCVTATLPRRLSFMPRPARKPQLLLHDSRHA